MCLRVLITFFQQPVSWWFTTHNEWKVLCTIALTLFFLDDSFQMNTLLIAALSMLQKGLHFLSDSIQATNWLQCVWHSTSFNNPSAFLWLVNFSPWKNIKALNILLTFTIITVTLTLTLKNKSNSSNMLSLRKITKKQQAWVSPHISIWLHFIMNKKLITTSY